jgi:hypothetical protein
VVVAAVPVVPVAGGAGRAQADVIVIRGRVADVIVILGRVAGVIVILGRVADGAALTSAVGAVVVAMVTVIPGSALGTIPGITFNVFHSTTSVRPGQATAGAAALP